MVKNMKTFEAHEIIYRVRDYIDNFGYDLIMNFLVSKSKELGKQIDIDNLDEKTGIEFLKVLDQVCADMIIEPKSVDYKRLDKFLSNEINQFVLGLFMDLVQRMNAMPKPNAPDQKKNLPTNLINSV